MRIIYGKTYESYTNPPKELGMVSLAERRDILCLKFAKKSLKVENFGHFFPVSSKRHNMQTRRGDIYKINKGYSKSNSIHAKNSKLDLAFNNVKPKDRYFVLE